MTPIWVSKFRDFPEIPACKKWIDGKHSTPEQDAAIKVLNNLRITENEEKVLSEAISFYKTVIPLFKKVDFNTFSPEDFENFKGYFNYVFNHLAMSVNEVNCRHIFRIVKNKSLLGEDKSIPNLSLLTYPTLDIVKKIGRYNRANTPDFNVLYGADSFDSAILEVKPTPGEMITVSIWKNKDPSRKIKCYPISHGKKAIEVNPSVKKGYQAFLDVKGNPKNHNFTVELLELVFDFLGDEFSKPVENHLDYFYSAIFSENIFHSSGDTSFDAILYPSVQNKYEYENLAIRPSFFDAHFQIEHIDEMVIEETHYDNPRTQRINGISSYVKPAYIKGPKQIGANGEIIW